MGKKAKARREKESIKVVVERPPMRSSPNWPLFALGVVGVLLTTYLTWTHWTGNSVKGCSVGSSCDIVLSSKWATLFGLPTSAWGLFAYATIGAIAFIKREDRHWQFAWIVSLFGVLYGAYLTMISLTVLHAACPYCLTSLLLMGSIFGFTTSQRPTKLPSFSWNSWLTKTVPAAAAVILVLHLYYSGFLGDAPTAEDPRAKAVAVHLAQTGAKMYGAFWCPHCQEQKSYFGASASRLPYIECSPDGQRSPQAAACKDAGINSYPTWIINGKRIEEVMTVKQLAEASGYKEPGS
jgi:uncharacterized membrane protein